MISYTVLMPDTATAKTMASPVRIFTSADAFLAYCKMLQTLGASLEWATPRDVRWFK